MLAEQTEELLLNCCSHDMARAQVGNSASRWKEARNPPPDRGHARALALAEISSVWHGLMPANFPETHIARELVEEANDSPLRSQCAEHPLRSR